MSILEEFDRLCELGYEDAVASDLCFVLGKAAGEQLCQEMRFRPFRLIVRGQERFDELLKAKLVAGELRVRTAIGSILVLVKDDESPNSIRIKKLGDT